MAKRSTSVPFLFFPFFFCGWGGRWGSSMKTCCFHSCLRHLSKMSHYATVVFVSSNDKLRAGHLHWSWSSFIKYKNPFVFCMLSFGHYSSSLTGSETALIIRLEYQDEGFNVCSRWNTQIHVSDLETKFALDKRRKINLRLGLMWLWYVLLVMDILPDTTDKLLLFKFVWYCTNLAIRLSDNSK